MDENEVEKTETPVSAAADPGTWTEERLQKLRSMWADDHSASEIGIALGVTRNAVIGKVHRLGIQKKVLGPRPPKPPQPMPQAEAPAPQVVPSVVEATPEVEATPVAPPPPEAPTPVVQIERYGVTPPVFLKEDVVVPQTKRVTLNDLRERSCRWPMGDPQKPDFSFCGAQKITGASYCQHHARMAFVPSKEQKRRVAS